MSAISHAGRLGPFSQLNQYFTALSSTLTSVCERADTAFRRVQVMKKDADGNIKLYDRKDPVTGAWTRVSTLSYIEDISTGNLYLDEPDYVIATKCALIALAMPLYTLGKLSWYVCKTVIETTTVALDTLFKVGQHLAQCKFSEGSVELRQGCYQMADSLGLGLFEIVKAPIFGFGAEVVALYGLVKPYHARVREALIENAWQQGASYKEDLRNVPARDGENCWEAFVRDIKACHPFYLAHCFQIRGNIYDPRIVVIRHEPLYTSPA